MEVFFVAKFTCSYNEWKSVYDGDLELRKQFMKDDIVGKVDENTAMTVSYTHLTLPTN